MTLPDYLHGFSKQEQDRLYRQARLLEASVYDHMDFGDARSLLEMGCGVGAQTEILLRRFPRMTITSLDGSKEQLRRAEAHLKDPVQQGRVKLLHAYADKVPLPSDSFDAVYCCWFLEHMKEPQKVIAEAKRLLSPGGILICNEPINSLFHIEPYSPAVLQYRFAWNDFHWYDGGDPFVGAKLGNLLLAEGFRHIKTRDIFHLYDNRDPWLRTQFIEYWSDLLLNAAPKLLQEKKVDETLIKEVQRELDVLATAKDSVVIDCWVQARGVFTN